MKIFSREFWGTIMIWLGVIIFLGVLYDSARPYFPAHPPYQFLKTIRSFFEKRFSPQPPPQKDTAPPPKPPPQRASRSALTTGKILTSDIHQTKGVYNLWVWGVKPERKIGDTVKVEIAHAAAGKEGGFQIVAYSDTNKDGRPDKVIAKSDFLTSQKAGDWSSFEFKSLEKKIFVGNTWPRGSNAWVFRGNGPWPQIDSPWENRFYIEISPNHARWAGPAYTNMKISFSD